MLHRFTIRAWLVALLALLPAAVPAQGYRVEPGDVLRVEVVEDETLNRNVLVAPDGQFAFPLAGSIQAGGRSISAIRNELISQLAPNFSNPPTVFVGLQQRAPQLEEPEELATVEIYVMGEVPQPGRLELEPGTTLLQAFAQMGGFSDFAAVKRIQLRRTDPVSGAERIYRLNYRDILQGRSANGRIAMQEGDVIVVPTRGLFE